MERRLTKQFDYYLIFNFQTVKVHTIEEITEIAVLVIDATTFQTAWQYHQLVKPAILKYTLEDKPDLTIHFNEFTRVYSNLVYELQSKGFWRSGLLVTIGSHAFENILPSQMAIERILWRPSAQDEFNLKFFNRWCDLLQVYLKVTGCSYPTEDPTIYLHRVLDIPIKLSGYGSCTGKAVACVRLIEKLVRTMNEQMNDQLFVTTERRQETPVSRPYLIEAPTPTFLRTFVRE